MTADHDEMLSAELIGWLTTVCRDQPQSSPVGFLWSHGSVWIRSQPQQLKVRNISRHPSVSFHLNQLGPRVVSMECQATRVDAFPDGIRALYNQKYEAMIGSAASIADQEARFSACLRLDPTRIRSS